MNMESELAFQLEENEVLLGRELSYTVEDNEFLFEIIVDNQNVDSELTFEVEENDGLLEPELSFKVEENEFLLETTVENQNMEPELTFKVEENEVLFETDVSFKVEENEILLETTLENQQTLNEVKIKEEVNDDTQIIEESIFVSVKEEPFDDCSDVNKFEDGIIFHHDELLTNLVESEETAPVLNKDQSLDSNHNGFLEQKIKTQTRNSLTSGKKKKYSRKRAALRSFTCDICQRSFKQLENLHLHQKFHNKDRPFPCGTCGKCFTTNGELKRHSVVHTGQKPYACTMCSKSFTQLCNMKAHLKNRCQPKRFGCSHCNRMFEDQHSLIKHEANHGTVKYKKYKRKIKDHHPPYFCDVCSMSFNGKKLLIAHMRTHFDFGDNLADTIIGVVCPICSKDCVKRKYLLPHVRTHSGEKPFVCETCGKGFSLKCNLKKHLVLHLPD